MFLTTKYGLGYVPRFLPFPQYKASALSQLLKYTSAMWLPSKADGQPFPTLAPRTLPNGVSNGQWTQNVSNDWICNNSTSYAFISFVLYGTTVKYTITKSLGTGGIATPNTSATRISILSGLVGFHYALDVDEDKHFYMDSQTDANINLMIPKSELASYDKDGFDTWIVSNPFVIRYQLATPIDTLNSPFISTIIDLAGSD